MAAPTNTSNQTLRAAASLAAATTASHNLDLRTKFEARLQFCDLGGGAVAATNGLQINIYRYVDGGSIADTIAVTGLVIPTIVSTANYASMALPTGHYKVEVKNLDATNAITVTILYETTDTVSYWHSEHSRRNGSESHRSAMASTGPIRWRGGW